jgi:hypothetical protein
MTPLSPRFSGYFAFKPPNADQNFEAYTRFQQVFFDRTEHVRGAGCSGNPDIYTVCPPDELDDAFFSLGKFPGVRMYYQADRPETVDEKVALEARTKRFFCTLA